ncbi:hypothetical protein RC80_03270 [Staphylococcus aureus]|nr:hypothetical protein RC80_03270 [Staphylococcus aureus]
MTEMVFYKIYFVVTPQLALSVEFLFEFLYVGAHPQLAHYCKLTFRQLLCWGPKNACYMVIFIRSTTTNIIL